LGSISRTARAVFDLIFVIVGGDADRIDQADLELARDNRGRHQAAARDRDDPGPGPHAVEPPGQRPRVAVELVPGDGEVFVGRQVHDQPL
jgi:hypothetical protein